MWPKRMARTCLYHPQIDDNGTFSKYFKIIIQYRVVSLRLSPIKTHKGDAKWPLFVNKQLFWWSASITLDNNNGVLTDF